LPQTCVRSDNLASSVHYKAFFNGRQLRRRRQSSSTDPAGASSALISLQGSSSDARCGSTTNCRTHSRLGFYTHTDITHTHTHPFNGPLSGTTRVSQYRKGKTNLDFTEARNSEWQWNLLGHMQVCISLQTTMPAPYCSVFYRPDAPLVAQPTVSRH